MPALRRARGARAGGLPALRRAGRPIVQTAAELARARGARRARRPADRRRRRVRRGGADPPQVVEEEDRADLPQPGYAQHHGAAAHNHGAHDHGHDPAAEDHSHHNDADHHHTAEGGANAGAPLTTWPSATRAWTVVLITTKDEARARARAREAARKSISAGVIHGADYAGFTKDEWIVFMGQYPKRAAASRAAKSYASKGFSGNPRFIKPKK